MTPTASTYRLVASTSPRCAAAAYPWYQGARRFNVKQPASNPLWPGLCTRHPLGVPTGGVVPFAAATSPSDALDGNIILDSEDAVSAAEVGSRTYLQLSDMSDESLQVCRPQPVYLNPKEHPSNSTPSNPRCMLNALSSECLIFWLRNHCK